MMIAILFYGCAILAGIKLMWNLWIPIEVLFFRSEKDRKTQNVSLMPIEVLFLLLMVFFSFLDNELNILKLNQWLLLLVGCVVIASTYAFIAVFLKIFKKRFI